MDQVENFRYQTWELEEMLRTIDRPNPFLLRMFFPNVKISDAAVIEWDIQEGARRLAPFVSPNVAGQPVRSRGHRTSTLRPAYIKPSALIRPAAGWVRRPGEAYGGQMTPKQRIDAKLAEQMAEHEDMLDNRLEWMASAAMVSGAITVAGDSYPSVTVDFGRNSNLNKTLGAGVKWSETNGVPLDDIEAMALDIRRYSYGAVADTVVMDGSAWALFRTKMANNVLFDATRRNGEARIDGGPRATIDGEEVGTISGRFKLWVYDGQYEDEVGVMQPYVPAYTAMVASRVGLEGKQYFGAIEDLHANLIAMKMFHKTQEKWDPSGVELVSQSAPLVAPKRPNAAGKIVVHS